MIVLWIVLALLVLILAGAYISFRMAFYVPEKSKIRPEFELPPGKVYEPYHAIMLKRMQETKQMPHEEVNITTFDGLTLRGKYYEYAPGAPIELMFHGYRGTAERDLCGGIRRCFRLGRNALLVDQRASSKSGGNVITFGLRESKDCLAWVDFMVKRFGPDVRIILCGISMGATTVLMAAGNELPPNVIGVLADCGFSNARDIIQKVIRQMKLPPKLLYPLVRLGARIYGGFDPEDADATKALKSCKVPVIFFHGEDDDYVPCQMSRINYEACPTVKQLVTIPGAGHGLSYLVDPEGYIAILREFGKNWGL